MHVAIKSTLRFYWAQILNDFLGLLTRLVFLAESFTILRKTTSILQLTLNFLETVFQYESYSINLLLHNS